MSLTSRKTALALLIALSWGMAMATIARGDTDATPAATPAGAEVCERVCALPQRTRQAGEPAYEEPTDREFADNRGVTEERRNDRYAAIRHFTAAYPLVPDHPAIAVKAKALGL